MDRDDRESLARQRIEAAGLRLPPERAEEILAAVPLMTGMTQRVRRAYRYTDEPAVTTKMEGVAR